MKLSAMAAAAFVAFSAYSEPSETFGDQTAPWSVEQVIERGKAADRKIALTLGVCLASVAVLILCGRIVNGYIYRNSENIGAEFTQEHKDKLVKFWDDFPEVLPVTIWRRSLAYLKPDVVMASAASLACFMYVLF